MKNTVHLILSRKVDDINSSHPHPIIEKGKRILCRWKNFKVHNNTRLDSLKRGEKENVDTANSLLEKKECLTNIPTGYGVVL